MLKLSLEEQVATRLNGSRFGDEELKQFMANELRQRLVDTEKEGRRLRVYSGYDVTGPHLHLGRTATMRKLASSRISATKWCSSWAPSPRSSLPPATRTPPAP